MAVHALQEGFIPDDPVRGVGSQRRIAPIEDDETRARLEHAEQDNHQLARRIERQRDAVPSRDTRLDQQRRRRVGAALQRAACQYAAAVAERGLVGCYPRHRTDGGGRCCVAAVVLRLRGQAR